jgi:hypothetical protein
MTHIRQCKLIAVIVACFVVAAHALGAAPLVNATIAPAQIAVGESAQLTITTLGAAMEPISLPEVSGLEFRIVGRSRRIEIVNGATFETTAIVIRVTAQTAGIFTIPGITPKSQPLVLRVNPDNGAANAPAQPPVVGSGSTASGIHLTADGSAFMRLSLPKREIYVGESVPVEIEVGMRAGFVTSLNGLPTLTGGDFTFNSLSRQPERVEKVIDGKPFTLMTWHSVLAAVKPGTFSLIVEAPLTVKIRTQPQRESLLDDLLGDPFLQNFFGATVTKDINVSSQPSEVTVLALPAEGRPADFSGAVGSFKIASDISSPKAEAGDPLTLRMRVTGSGNFDRVDTAMLEHVDQWRTYPPKSSFTPSDALGYKGEKVFEQPVIASKPGAQTLPGLAFSYFDPSTRRYETARAPPLSVAISPSLADSTQKAPGVAAGAPPAPAGPLQSGLRPDHAAAASSVNSLIPLYLQPRFLAIPSLLALMFAAGWVGTRRPGGLRGKNSARLPVNSKAINRVLAQLDAAARSGNSALFFNSARGALRQALAARWQVTPEEITMDEIDARLGRENDEIHQLFDLADEANYSGRKLQTADFARWTRIVRQQLMAETPS